MLNKLVIASLLFCSSVSIAQENGVNHRFQSGESLSYSIYYYLMGVWVGAGDVTFKVEEENFSGKPCYKFKGYGATLSRYDWFYNVRDTYTAYSSKETLEPFRFYRDVSEGSEYYMENNIYDYSQRRIYSQMNYKDEPQQRDTLILEEGSFDVLSLMYHTRDLDFASYVSNDKIPIKMVIDGAIYDLYIRFLGTEIYDHSEMGKIECYVFSPLLVDGTIFKGGEKMKVWVSKDENVVPIYIQSEIRVGSIRAELKAYSGIKSGAIKTID